MRDVLAEAKYDDDETAECVDTFIVNAKYLGLLRPVAGAERLLPLEYVLEEHASGAPASSIVEPPVEPIHSGVSPSLPSRPKADWQDLCFYIAPIGEANSEIRQHSDLFLGSIVEPALQEFKLRLVRADQIAEAGMIGRQVVEHVVHAKLVVADLSFGNPNVFYELSLRHACRKPTVQIIRAVDKLPFDLEQYRTIRIDTSSIYTLVPQLDTYRAEIANQVRTALANPDAVDNPISAFLPLLRVTFGTS